MMKRHRAHSYFIAILYVILHPVAAHGTVSFYIIFSHSMADSSQAGAAGAYTSVHRVEASDEVRPGAQ
jgi:hypothetical protein